MSDKRQATSHGDHEYQGERLQRVLAQRGVASRRAAEKMIVDGRVQVNGRVITELGTRVNPNRDELRLDGRVLRAQLPRHIILNKPSGFITTVSDERDRWTVMDLVDVRERVYPVGRLDRATQGLVLLTNDGDLAHRVMHPRYEVDKEYLVFTDARPTEAQLQKLRDGVSIEGRAVVPKEVRLFRESSEGVAVLIVLHEGLYHVVRRLMEAVGIEVTRLRRTRLGPLRVQGIPSGAWRDLTPGELVQLYQSVGLPVEDAEAANSRRTIVTAPVGGYTHQGGAAAPTRSGKEQRTEHHQPERRQPERKTDRSQRSDRPPRRKSSGHGNPRSPQGHRDRRTRRGR